MKSYAAKTAKTKTMTKTVTMTSMKEATVAANITY